MVGRHIPDELKEQVLQTMHKKNRELVAQCFIDWEKTFTEVVDREQRKKLRFDLGIRYAEAVSMTPEGAINRINAGYLIKAGMYKFGETYPMNHHFSTNPI